MSADLEQRLQEALDAQALSDELRREIAGHPELESMIEQDAALRAMPRMEVDFSESVLSRLDDAFEDIPGLLDAPVFEVDAAPSVSPGAASNKAAADEAASSRDASSRVASSGAGTPAPAPRSLDDERRKRSAAPFLLAAAAVIGLVATGTLMTLNAPRTDQLAMEAAQPAPASVGMPQDYASGQGPRGSLAASEAEEAPEEAASLEADEWAPVAAAPAETATAEPELAEPELAEPVSAFGDGALAELDMSELERSESRARTARPAAPSRASGVMSSARGGAAADSLGDSLARDSLSASQRRTVARIESCLPDSVHITRVRESSDGQRVVGVETSEPLSEEVDECVSGVLDTFPRARRRRRSAAMSTPPPTTAGAEDM